MKLSVSHPDLTMIRFEVNHCVMEHQINQLEYVITIDQPAHIEIFFEPWKIKPLIRIDNHLIDYWLANANQYDHMIQLFWDNDFYHHYRERDIKSKMQYIGLHKQEDIDNYLGINNTNLEIVNQIKKYLA